MKRILSIDANEIAQAVVAMVTRRESMRGRFMAAAHLILDPANPRPELRVRVNVVHFDTEKAAIEYQQSIENPKPNTEGASDGEQHQGTEGG